MGEKQKATAVEVADVMEDGGKDGYRSWVNISSRFALLNKLIRNDLNNSSKKVNPRFYLYTRDEIVKYLSDPYRYKKEIKNAVTYIYGASSHFERIIQYMTSLTYFRYIVTPYKIDTQKVNQKTLRNNYHRVLNLLNSANLETELRKILEHCFKYDVFYGTIWQTADNLSIQQLPDEYCAITESEGNVFNVTFDLSYFDLYPGRLEYYPEEFKTKYAHYKNAKGKKDKWVVLDSPRSFAVKFNDDIPDYPIPPFAGLLREIYDLEDYKNLKLTKTEIENYALLVMKLLMDDDGRWLLDEKKSVEIFNNLSAVLPDEVGAVLSPMNVEKISFDRNAADDTDTVSKAEESIFMAAGVPSLLFSNSKASANALLLSIKADQAMTFALVKSVENVLNRFIQSLSYGKMFRMEFLDISRYNEKEASDQYLKACQYGAPMIIRYCASLGLKPDEVENMNFLETSVLELPFNFVPLVGSAQVSADNQPGRPRKDDEELTDSGAQSRQDGVEDGNW